MRGLRLNLQHAAVPSPATLRARARRLGDIAADRGLFLAVYAPWDAVGHVVAAVADLPVPVLLDHFGGIRWTPDGVPLADQVAVVAAVLRHHEHAWVKVSAPERVLGDRPDLRLLEPAVRSFLSAAPNWVVWGSDWPHTGGRVVEGISGSRVQLFRAVDDAGQVTWLAGLLRRHGLLDDVLVRNPRRLFNLPAVPERKGRTRP